ncbi:atypical RIO protein kinase [Blastocystis sp. subtype 4]|uniref:atypical RIO protein kinase n=1 Tax=Blastocystis sp. subtype 4 TaxID=944170 RepID=UPI000711F0E5|nr:atypical RIO protein kinase [Blastocystis sp. subtype 4]KNB46219.1 atypical RIO protein kinase [Blastocystis sp. subtype 4]|eukprot:XP_014529662.1 atypical RIO protein kinase [Blastocystis sp. subtype 4]
MAEYSLSSKVEAAINKQLATEEEGKAFRHTGRDDRATTENVMDPRTRFILYQMLNRGQLREMNGCISTGKEANVYHAIGAEANELAVKIYKTSILIFKDRERYVAGDFRFRHGFNKSNPRKMVAMWAEKERRNLGRLHAAGLPVPEPISLTRNVLVMEFLGENGWPAPRLKDVALTKKSYERIYRRLVLILRTMYQECRLVHGDLSEYNLLYYRKDIWIIDVSQSVEIDHPNALHFLRNDCKNVTDYFSKNGVDVMTTRELFDFVTRYSLKEEDYDDVISRSIEYSKEVMKKGTYENEEQVFMSAFIPQNLFEVVHIERDITDMKLGNIEEIFYSALTGIDIAMKQAANRQEEDDDDEKELEFENEFEKNFNEEEVEKVIEEHTVTLPLPEGTGEEVEEEKQFTKRNATKEEKKAHKQMVKESKREKRKTKIPKAVKKRAEKVARMKK